MGVWGQSLRRLAIKEVWARISQRLAILGFYYQNNACNFKHASAEILPNLQNLL